MGETKPATKEPRRKGAHGEAVFMTKSQLAHAMGHVETTTIDEWVEAGTIPPPHSRPGIRTALWLRRHFDHYVKTRRWPEEAWPKEGG